MKVVENYTRNFVKFQVSYAREIRMDFEAFIGNGQFDLRQVIRGMEFVGIYFAS